MNKLQIKADVQVKMENFIDFALYILNATGNELARLDNEWKKALKEPDPVKEVKKFAKREGFDFSTEECSDALEFWGKFMEENPDCETGCPEAGGPVMY